MNLRIAGVLVGAALVATACGGSAPNLINQAVQAPAQNDVAEQAHQGNTRQANAKAAQDTANAKAAAAVTVAPKAVAPKAVAAPKAAPRYTSGNPDCAHLSEYLASDFLRRVVIGTLLPFARLRQVSQALECLMTTRRSLP